MPLIAQSEGSQLLLRALRADHADHAALTIPAPRPELLATTRAFYSRPLDRADFGAALLGYRRFGRC